MTTTTTTTKTKTRKAEPDSLTFEQIAERKLRDKLTAYRELVARAAAGEQLPEADLEAATELLSFLGLPSYSWARDCKAKGEYDAAVKAEAEARANRPAQEARLKAVMERLKALEKEVAELNAERHRLGPVTDNLLVFYGQRRRELETESPHVLAAMDDAVRFRLEQQQRRKGVTLTEGGR